jgi:hypothetical protein
LDIVILVIGIYLGFEIWDLGFIFSGEIALLSFDEEFELIDGVVVRLKELL